jgi:excisionase family DNA binding protein
VAIEGVANAMSEDPRLAYRVNEAAKLLGVSRRTIERRIKDKTLKTTKMLGVRLIEAESVKALFEPSE